MPSALAFVRIRLIRADDAENLASGAMSCEEIASSVTFSESWAPLVQQGETWTSQFTEKPLLSDISQYLKDTIVKEDSEGRIYAILYEVFPEGKESEEAVAVSDRIWAMSLPIVLIDHSLEYCDGYARIIWKREFNKEVQDV
uniref:SH2 domain-containing protein n=1 Tax=Plectus sambesii TaxID=2011161 RepID=A0A914W8M3_9BILA